MIKRFYHRGEVFSIETGSLADKMMQVFIDIRLTLVS